MKNNIPKDQRDAGTMLSQKTNEDYNKKQPVPADLKRKTYQKDNINDKPSDQAKTAKELANKDNLKTKNKTDEFAGAEFIDKE